MSTAFITPTNSFCPTLATVQLVIINGKYWMKAIFWTDSEISIFISVVNVLIQLPRMPFAKLLSELDLVYISYYRESTFIIISAARRWTKSNWEIIQFWKSIFRVVQCNCDTLALTKINWSDWTSPSSSSWSSHDCRSDWTSSSSSSWRSHDTADQTGLRQVVLSEAHMTEDQIGLR